LVAFGQIPEQNRFELLFEQFVEMDYLGDLYFVEIDCDFCGNSLNFIPFDEGTDLFAAFNHAIEVSDGDHDLLQVSAQVDDEVLHFLFICVGSYSGFNSECLLLG
jgi:hypothetical protein